jgi:hypothetical protein
MSQTKENIVKSLTKWSGGKGNKIKYLSRASSSMGGGVMRMTLVAGHRFWNFKRNLQYPIIPKSHVHGSLHSCTVHQPLQPLHLERDFFLFRLTGCRGHAPATLEEYARHGTSIVITTKPTNDKWLIFCATKEHL